MENTCKITLADGTELKDLSMNGNNFVSTKTISKEMFDANCSPVVISDGKNEEYHANMALVHVTDFGGVYWFALRDIPEAELAAIKNRSDIDYIALMCDVEL